MCPLARLGRKGKASGDAEGEIADIDARGLDFTPSGSLFLTDTGSSIVLHGISSSVGVPKGTLISIR